MVTFPTALAQSQTQLPVYKTIPMQVNSSYVSSLGANLFGMTGNVQESGGVFMLNETGRTLLVFNASGGIWYGDLSALYNESYTPTLPDNATAQSMASSFLSQHNLMPAEASFSGIANTQSCNEQTTGAALCKKLDVQVMYSFQLGNLPVSGPGAKIKVTLGNQGQIIGLEYFWRRLASTPVGTYVEQNPGPVNKSCQTNARATNPQVQLMLAYYADNGMTMQNYLQPTYICSGTATTLDSSGTPQTFDLRTSNFPATDFSPIVSIVNPVYGSIVKAGTPVTFQANITGGTGPYQIQWTSQQDGVIGTTSSFNYVPSIAQRNGNISAYAIILTVTDANGQVGTAITYIKVVPPSTPTLTTYDLALFSIILLGVLLAIRVRKPNVRIAVVLLIFLLSASFFASVSAYQYGAEYIGVEVGCDSDSNNFVNAMAGGGWANKFYWTEPNAWERDFKYEGAPGTGDAHNWVDTVDFQWYCGHANGNGFAFRTDQDDRWLDHTDAGSGKWTTDSHGWGTTLKWIIIAACGPLQYTESGQNVFDRWGPAFKGLHYILAYSTTSGGTDAEGTLFALYSRLFGLPVRLAWLITGIIAQGSSVKVAYMRAGSGTADTYNDHLPGFGSYSSNPFPKTYLAWLETNC